LPISATDPALGPDDAAPPGGEDRSGGAERWFSHQPNVTGRGILASYSWRFWALVVGLGIGTGIAASLLMAILKAVETTSYGYSHGSFLDGVSAAPGWRHVLVLGLAALVVAAGVIVLGRLPSSGGSEISEALWVRGSRLAFRASIARSIVSIVSVAMGVSLGREAAPQLTGAAIASKFSDWAGLPTWQRRLLLASGAGAGFAAVYNVPLGGALFALEVLLGSVALPLVLPALATSVIATAVGWITLGTRSTYHIPSYPLQASQVAFAVALGPIVGLAAIGWARAIAWINRLRPRGRGRLVAPLVVFLALGLISIPYPQLLGNGKDIVQLAAVGKLSVGLMAVLLVLKPLATASCLGSGSPGGLFTPTLTLGALLAGVCGALWTHLWPGTLPGSYVVIGGGAFIAATMQGPLSGLVLVLELTRHADTLMAPTLITVIIATVIARRLGAHSIYSARIRHDPKPSSQPSAQSTEAAAVQALDDDAEASTGSTGR
jgi:CIC family chloride channel protein